jgi:hypothetical protein
MSKTIIGEEAFPEIMEQYNSGGKTAAYDYLRSRYGIKHPYFVIKRIKECGKYAYNADTNQFSVIGTSAADSVFMDLDELCATTIPAMACRTDPVMDTRSTEMENWFTSWSVTVC